MQNYTIPQTDLPVGEIISTVLSHFQKENTLIVKASTGAGKSTVLPLSFLNESWLQGKKIILLEPRRLAAKSIAVRMAELLGEPVGKSVGYRIRFETRVSENTRIEVVTEGILTRMLQSDNSIEDVALVIFDEFHERSIHADVALALCREAQQILRPDLKLLVMSATMDLPQLSSLLDAKIVESAGKQYPVEIHYGNENNGYMLAEMTAKTVHRAIQETTGDVLVFLPGKRDILKCKDLLSKDFPKIQVHALYGMMPFNAQQAAILPDKEGRRKVVIATSIAETSLTIKGITAVVDCGYTKTSKFNPKSGLSHLETVTISVDAADQRSGRAGRLMPGTCYRMWSKHQHNHLDKHHHPEIEDADLCSLVLEMAAWGINDLYELAWLTPPPKAHVNQALDTLHQIEALENNKITAHGKQIHELPCHPRIAHMLIKSEEMEQEALATDIAAIVEEKDVMAKEAGVDLTLRVEALRRFRTNNGKGRAFGMIDKVAKSYRDLLEIEVENDSFDFYHVGLLLAYAFPERIAYARPGNNSQFQLANGKIASFSHKDELAHESWLAVAQIDGREGMGTIFLAAPLNPRDLAPMVKEAESIVWDEDKDGISAQKQLRIGRIILKSTPIQKPDPTITAQIVSDWVKKNGEHVLNFSKEVIQWQNRVYCAAQWTKEEYPIVTKEHLLANADEWLLPFLMNVKKREELEKLDLLTILKAFLSYEKQQELDKIAPTKLKVPSGSVIPIQYFDDGKAPIIEVRLQELFGLKESPTVNFGKISIVLHLLSPGFKPVQVTSDLVSFWNNTYHEVKKELKRRYPKHEWPEDPWIAEAIRGVKRRN